MQKEVNWKGRVRIIAVNFDSYELDDREKYDNQKKHLKTVFIPRFCIFSNDFKIGENSNLILVNKFGKIDYIGDIKDIDP